MPKHEAEWEKFGHTDPYYGVLTREDYRAESITEDALIKFYESGEAHIASIMRVLRQLYDINSSGRVLDFGCGVGRLVLPLAKHFSNVVGVDISQSMIEIAKKRASAASISNVDFFTRISDVPGEVDLAHSYIVFQHIPVKTGLELIKSIADRIKSGGILAIHLIFVIDRSRIRYFQSEIRKRSTIWHYAMNMITGKKWNMPLMELNCYPLNKVSYVLYKSGFGRIQLINDICTDFASPIFSGFLFAQKYDPVAKLIEF